MAENTKPENNVNLNIASTKFEMARILSETLIKYQSEEEAKVMKIGEELDESGKELVKQLYEPLKITSEDLSLEYNQSEIKQLCLRTKVRVDMTLFNCVWDAKQRLDKKGRLKNRSERFVNKMLVKAISRQMVAPYSKAEIERCNHIRQCQLKKDNICRLKRWRNASSQASVLERSSPEPSSTQSSEIPTNYLAFPNSQSSASTLGILSSQSEMEEVPVNDEIPEIPEKSKGMETPDDLTIASTPDMAWAEAAAQINTESMTFETLDLDLQTQQTQSEPIIGSEDYVMFDTQVPATSTQTPCTEPFL